MARIEAIRGRNDAHIMNTYGARRVALARGEGCRLWDVDGREYLDMFAGIAVCNLGHCHPHVTEAMKAQAETLVHVSNLYYTEPQIRLAERLSEQCFADQWFFANCGATANEAAIKLARRYWAEMGTPKPHIICAQDSFHGRTLAAITATGQPKYHAGFEPLVQGFGHVPYNDLAALEAAITPETGAIMLEAIQGEGGVRVPDAGYLQGVRACCDRHGLLFILDEVQTGMGRTGRLFAHQHADITPDIMTLAKALGNGIPIGAMGVTSEAAKGFAVGSHATTFGGNPLAAAAANAVLDVMLAPGFLEGAAEKGAYFMDKLRAIAAKHSRVAEVRGRGLMVGVELNEPAAPVVGAMIDAGILCGPAGPQVVRFVPALTIDYPQLDRAADAFAAVLAGEAVCTT